MAAVPYEKMASPVQTYRPTKRWLRRNGTSRVPYEKMASPVQTSRHMAIRGTAWQPSPTHILDGMAIVPYMQSGWRGSRPLHHIRDGVAAVTRTHNFSVWA